MFQNNSVHNKPQKVLINSKLFVVTKHTKRRNWQFCHLCKLCKQEMMPNQIPKIEKRKNKVGSEIEQHLNIK